MSGFCNPLKTIDSGDKAGSFDFYNCIMTHFFIRTSHIEQVFSCHRKKINGILNYHNIYTFPERQYRTTNFREFTILLIEFMSK